MSRHDLVLNRCSCADYLDTLSNPRLELAADELDKLLRGRFGAPREEEQPVSFPVRFVVNDQLKGFSAAVKDGVLCFRAPGDVELLYAVYDFAEKCLGYCFFEPGVDRLEKVGGKLRLKEGKLFGPCRPRLRYRGFIQEFPFSEDNYVIADWMAKNKLNYLYTWMIHYDGFDADYKEFLALRGIEVEAGHHNFSYLIPTQEYYHDHPEYFAEKDGKRIQPRCDGNGLLLGEQLCTTNPGLRDELVRKLLAYSAAHPEIKHISLVPNDGFGWCECAECSKFYDKSKKGDLYSLSEHVYKADRIYHDLIRYVAGKLREAGATFTLVNIAYINYCAPSPGYTLQSGQAAQLALYWRCINHKIQDKDCPVNSQYVKDIKAWEAAKQDGEFFIYEYLMGVNFYLSLPMIHHKAIFDETKFLAKHGVDGYLTQFHLPHWTAYGVNFYMMAKALYGEKRTASCKAWYRALFGKDADDAKKFYAKLRKLQKSAGECLIPYPYALFSRTEAKEYEKLHRAAVRLAAKAPRDNFRQELVLWTEYMKRFKAFFDAYHAGSAGVPELDAFCDWVHTTLAGTRCIVMFQFDIYTNSIRQQLQTGKPWVHYGLDWEDAYIRKHHESILAPRKK